MKNRRIDNKTFVDIRMYLGLTQQEMADLLGVSIATIAHIETNRLHVTENVKYKLAKHFDVTDDFITYQESKERISSLLNQ